MGVTSVIHKGLQTPHPLNFDKKPIANSIVPPNSIAISVFSRNSSASELSYSPFLVRNSSRTHLFPLAYAKRTEEEDGVFTASEWDGSSTPSYDESREVGKSHQSSASGSSLKEKHGPPESYKSSVRTVALCIDEPTESSFFKIGFYHLYPEFKPKVIVRYLLEQSLSVDNLFVFVLIFKYFKVPLMYQNRVLAYGIAGAIVFRLSLILLGTATLQRFEVVNLLLAAILLYSSIKLFGAEEEEEDLSDNFIVKTCQKFIPVTGDSCESVLNFCISSILRGVVVRAFGLHFMLRLVSLVDVFLVKFPVQDSNPTLSKLLQLVMMGIDFSRWRMVCGRQSFGQATPLLLTVAVIELSDIAFAVGLRSLYTLISESMAELEYLQPAIAVVLGFIGFKMTLDYFGGIPCGNGDISWFRGYEPYNWGPPESDEEV
ncbi:hypothetical protein Cgig2_004532 [Carnegiea gigantea]|uniref:Uncharacterized protein n=1 Tax=Carnegiea gigantea TaxID=171969 RepID=A0A9Q1K8S1_9CARY|nr:hypothetical protein Cgig2_004532 [Carnegiea gigantea]